MTTFVPMDVQAAMDAARVNKLKQSSKLRIETTDGYFRVLRLWNSGFSVASEDAPHLRGFVDVYEGSLHLFQCLIIASEEEGGEMQYEFKRMTAVCATPPLDFVAETEAPAALIEDMGLPA